MIDPGYVIVGLFGILSGYILVRAWLTLDKKSRD